MTDISYQYKWKIIGEKAMKKKQNVQKVSCNYNLKSDSVESLAQAGQGRVHQYSKEELEQYRSRSRLHIPEPLKLMGIKLWFAGAVCFFILWGLGLYVSSMLDMLFILGIVLGVVTDLLTNNVIRFMEQQPGKNNRWIMVNLNGVFGMILNVLYACVIIVCVFLLYNFINYSVVMLTENSDVVFLGVEPILFGVFCMTFDMLFLTIKSGLLHILHNKK